MRLHRASMQLMHLQSVVVAKTTTTKTLFTYIVMADIMDTCNRQNLLLSDMFIWLILPNYLDECGIQTGPYPYPMTKRSGHAGLYYDACTLCALRLY